MISREDQQRIELATGAALELDNIRLGRLGEMNGNVARLIAWLAENFRSDVTYEPRQTICLRDVLLKTGLLPKDARLIADLIEAVGQVEILLRGIIAEPVSARKSIPTIVRMRDFCLALARA